MGELPTALEFVESDKAHVPADDGTFDWVLTWSAFEHISDPLSVAKEMRRILRPDGLLFLQLYPFFHSAWGSHLEDWYPEPFVQHRVARADVHDHLRRNPLERGAAWSEYMIDAYDTLNEITLDDLQAALTTAGFEICKAELYTAAVHLPKESQQVALSSLLINGVKLLARPV
jgi:ubiquinone/menaquinone biosynthesis C-methylase UbiE